MPRPVTDVNSADYRAILRHRDFHRRYGARYKDMLWAEEVLERLEKKSLREDYSPADHADFLKVKQIYARVFAKSHAEDSGETADSHTTARYIWRTRHDGKVRPEHAANDGKVFAWNHPSETGHPGQGFGCRCWAEPYEEGALQERVSQVVTTYTQDSVFMWNDKDLKFHYFNGNGHDLSLGQIGLLKGVIDYARTKPQKSGGSVFDRVARRILAATRKNGEGYLTVDFGTSYDFKEFMHSFGDSTIEGNAQVQISEENDSLIISAQISYAFWDQYKDPIDTYDIIPGTFEIPGGMVYDIVDAWTVRLDAIIKKDSSKSIYPDDEFGSL